MAQRTTGPGPNVPTAGGATDCTVGAEGWAPLAVGEGCARATARFTGAGRGDTASDRLPVNYNAGGAAMARAVMFRVYTLQCGYS